MTHKLANMVKQTSTSVGATTISLNGAALSPYRSFATVLSNGDTTAAMVVHRGSGVWQAALYTYANDDLTFAELIDSSTGSVVTFASGVKDVYIPPLARNVPKEIYAADYGVIADNDAVNLTTNTTRLQRALTAAEGGVLILPPGDIWITGPTAGTCLTAPAGGVTIRGAGRFTTILKTTAACVIIAAVDADEVDIRDVGFDGGATGHLPWSNAIVFRGVVKGSIRNCWFTGIGQDVINCAELGFGGSDSIPNGTRQCEKLDISYNLIEDCFGTIAIITKYVGALDLSVNDNIVSNSCAVGISVESEGGFALGAYADRIMVCRNKVLNVSWLNVTSGNVAYGIAITEQARRVICTDNIVAGVVANTLAAGILIGSSPSQSDTEVDHVTVSNNNISDVSAATGRGHGIHVQTGDVDITALHLSGNMIDAVEDGITFETATTTKTLGTIKDLSVIGNTLTDCTEFGLWSNNTASSGELPVERATISHNIVTDAGSHGIALFLKHAVLASNIVSSSGGIGIFIMPGSSDILFTGNRSTGNSADGINATGDRLTFADNQCLNNGQGGATSYGLILADGSIGGQIINNRCSDTQGSPTQDYGIRAPAGTLRRDNIVLGNVSGPYFNGGVYASWVTTQNRVASVNVAADNAEHTVLTDTVPQNNMALAGMALRITVGYFGTWANASVIFRLKLGATTLSTVTLALSALVREGTIVWEVGQTGVPGARCNMAVSEIQNAATTTVRVDPIFDVSFDTTGADQDITVTAQIVNAGDTMSVGRYAVEHLGW